MEKPHYLWCPQNPLQSGKDLKWVVPQSNPLLYTIPVVHGFNPFLYQIPVVIMSDSKHEHRILRLKSQNRLEMGHDTDHISCDLNINDGLNRFIGRRCFLNSALRSQRDTINSR